MRKIGAWIAFLGAVFLSGACSKQQVEMKEIDGVVHVINPAEPIKGAIRLQVENTLEINPYDHEEVRLRYFDFCRDSGGGVILYNPEQTEALMFDGSGRCLGPLLRQGQGPGEFPDFSFFRVFMTESAILVAGSLRLATFDRTGNLLGETRIRDSSIRLIDDHSYITEEKIPDEKGLYKEIVYVELSDREDVEASRISLFECPGVGMIRLKKGGAFGSTWVTPEVLFAPSLPARTIYLAHNKEYKIFLKDLKGELLRVIERLHRNVKLNQEGRRRLLAEFKGGNLKAIEAALPDELIALGALKSLPRGWLAAFRVAGVGELEVDVFDPEGKYVYRLEPPPGIPLSAAVFHETGFAVIEEMDDFRVYRDYRIRNLAEIFE